MAEIVSIAVGQCGSEVCTRFFGEVAIEHGIDAQGFYHGKDENLQLENIGVYFRSLENGKLISRSVFADCESECLDVLRSGPSMGIHKIENIVNGEYSCNKNWSSGFYIEGVEILGAIMEPIRREVECCDRFQGFQLTHSIGGGAGAGIGSLLISTLREEFSDTIMSTFSVVPSYKANDFPVSPYSAAFTAHYLIDDCDMCYLFDTETLFTTLLNGGFDPKATSTAKHFALTNLIVPAIVGATCALRFPRQLAGDLVATRDALVTFPRLHFLSTVVTPLTSRSPLGIFTVPEGLQSVPFIPYCATSTPTATTTGTATTPTMAATNSVISHPFYPRYYNCLSTYRGRGSVYETADLTAVLETLADRNCGVSRCEIPSSDAEDSVVQVGNHSSVQSVWERISAEYNAIFRRKAYLSIYMGNGMDEMECVQAKEDLVNLIAEYKERNKEGENNSNVESM